MKRIISVFLAVAIILSLTACSGSGGPALIHSKYQGTYQMDLLAAKLNIYLDSDNTWGIEETFTGYSDEQRKEIVSILDGDPAKMIGLRCGTWKEGEDSKLFLAVDDGSNAGDKIATAFFFLGFISPYAMTYDTKAEMLTMTSMQNLTLSFPKVDSSVPQVVDPEELQAAKESVKQNGNGLNMIETTGSELGSILTLEDLNIRTGPGTGYNTTGVLKKGNSAYYYEIKNAEGYTWYRITDNSWIANDGTWLEVDGIASGSDQTADDKARIKERAIESLKDYAEISESRADSTFEWLAYETGNNTYHVSYEGDIFGNFVVISAEVVYDPKTDTLEMEITEDNRDLYNPDKDYWAETEAEYNGPYEEPEYTEQETAVIKAVEEHCLWWNKFLSSYPANERTKGSYWVWSIEATDVNAWHAALRQVSVSGAANVYECDAVWDGSKYIITDTEDWISDTL